MYHAKNGFVHTAVQAYSGHHRLVIRPDDVWNAIISQLSFYVNKNAEQLRDLFVAHEGKKELRIIMPAWTVETIDYGDFALQMSKLLEENILDPELRGWIQQEFTTTTSTDRIISSVVFMSTMKKYFDYSAQTKCGLPSVTLLGEKEDWEKIYSALHKLDEFGSDTQTWRAMLQPVLRHFILTFDKPKSPEVNTFWQRICHRRAGSGFDYCTGWLSAFCYFGKNGACVLRGANGFDDWEFKFDQNDSRKKNAQNASQTGELSPVDLAELKWGRGILELDGVKYHKVDFADITPGYVEVPVKAVQLTATGEVVYEATMVAGSIGMKIESSGEATEDGGIGSDTLVPSMGWWIYSQTN
ncbi:hypothetical protein K432DRAFT_361193 [Lepidopterella palustris CBS 459.81]|uniref:DUF4419 domain-containing protein n=1 Tax=Lepidopterella palustris CBS 459.81 TaxID=1314670 RepID=A0A8E2E238_9PEZI|nr:hypothetical protein K432DRAFT_361193 [Lepidopterella palustris CBS 459.81]